jgi:hypothetical protein
LTCQTPVSCDWTFGPNGQPCFCWDSFFAGDLASLNDLAMARLTIRTMVSDPDAAVLVPEFAHGVVVFAPSSRGRMARV